MPVAIERRLTAQQHRLSQLELMLQGFDPQLLLSRGYSITLHHGKAVRDPQMLHPGDEIETRVEKGSFHATVTPSLPQAMNEQLQYEQALAQLETIVRKMENNEFDIDELAVQLKTARQLIQLCREKLTKAEKEISEINTEGQ